MQFKKKRKMDNTEEKEREERKKLYLKNGEGKELAQKDVISYYGETIRRFTSSINGDMDLSNIPIRLKLVVDKKSEGYKTLDLGIISEIEKLKWSINKTKKHRKSNKELIQSYAFPSENLVYLLEYLKLSPQKLHLN